MISSFFIHTSNEKPGQEGERRRSSINVREESKRKKQQQEYQHNRFEM
jgi:hypothetical protein